MVVPVSQFLDGEKDTNIGAHARHFDYFRRQLLEVLLKGGAVKSAVSGFWNEFAVASRVPQLRQHFGLFCAFDAVRRKEFELEVVWFVVVGDKKNLLFVVVVFLDFAADKRDDF